MSFHAKTGPPGSSLSTNLYPNVSGPPVPSITGSPTRGSGSPLESGVTALALCAVASGPPTDGLGMRQSRVPSPALRIVSVSLPTCPVKSVAENEDGDDSKVGGGSVTAVTVL